MKRDADETMRRLATVFPLSRRRVAGTWLAGCALHPTVMWVLGAPGTHLIAGTGLVAALTGAVIAATATLVDRVEATTRRADDLRDLSRIAATATELESGRQSLIYDADVDANAVSAACSAATCDTGAESGIGHGDPTQRAGQLHWRRCDLMHGLPGQSLALALADLDRIFH